MTSEATPRINAKYLEQFSNQTVRLVGKVVSLRGEMASLEADGSVIVLLNRVSYTVSSIPSPWACSITPEIYVLPLFGLWLTFVSQRTLI